MFTSITPELPVRDVVQTQAYYKNVLGFQIDWLWEDNFGSVSNGEVSIFLRQEINPVPGIWCYLTVENADEAYRLYKSKGVKVVEALASKPWGMKEFTIQDNNGHYLRIGHGEATVADIDAI